MWPRMQPRMQGVKAVVIVGIGNQIGALESIYMLGFTPQTTII